MILSKRFPYGRLSNGLFQYAFLKALSVRLHAELELPLWPASQYFHMGRSWAEDKNREVSINKKEPYFDFNKDLINCSLYNTNENVNFLGYFQSEKYFEDVWDKIKEEFLFEDFVLDRVSWFSPKSEDYCVHARRGDYVGHKRYINLSPEYYIDFFREKPHNKFYIFSDDYNYCVENFQHKNVEVVDVQDAIKSLCILSKFKNHIIANSSFSWWGAKLAELYNGNVSVIRPSEIFKLKIDNNTGKDFFPQRWTSREIKEEKPKKKDSITIEGKDYSKLENITFVIPVSYDSKDRKENLDIVYKYIRTFFGKVDIIIGEQGSGYAFKKFGDLEGVKYIYYDEIKSWHRTKIINNMIKEAKTDIVAVWDADVLVPSRQVFSAHVLVNKGDCDIVYPYDGSFIKMGKSWTWRISNNLDILNKFQGEGEDMKVVKHSFGGAFIVKKKSYLKAGLENENFMIWGREDVERYERMNKLGYKSLRIEGSLYHLHHYIGDNSSIRNDCMDRNNAELKKVTEMSEEELVSYIKTWKWVN